MPDPVNARPDVREALQVPLLRTKRYHRKSRAGCIKCKQRRVKVRGTYHIAFKALQGCSWSNTGGQCDEERPECRTCTRKGLECVYEASRPATASEEPPDSNSNSPGDQHQAFPRSLNGHSSPSSSSPTSAEQTDLVLESELAQTYLEHVAPSFSRSCTNDEQTWIWHVFVPAQALVSSTIRHGLLTSAAIYSHFRAQEAGQVPDPALIEVATSHGNVFVEQSRAQLHKLEPQQVNANLAATRLLCVLALAFHRHGRASGENQGTSWTWIHLLKGVKTVHEFMFSSGQAIQPRILEDMIPKSPTTLSAESNASISPESSAASSEMLLYISSTRSARFATLRFANSQGWFGLDGTEPNVLSTSIDSLSDITELVCARQYTSLFRTLSSWIAGLEAAVVQMLIDAHPGALAIYTHWLMLLALAEDLWWIGDMGRAGIRDVINVIGGSTNELTPVLSWPREILQMK